MNKSISSNCTFFEPTLEEHIRFSLARMELLRITVDRIDPFTTTIITFSEILEEAIEHYNHVDPPLSKLPNFLLVDWQGKDESWKEITDKYNIHIFPAHHLKNLCPVQCCLYAKPSQRHWEKGCYSPLVESCASLGLTSGYQIDAAVTAPLWHRPADPAFIEKRFSDICTVYNAMADDDSKETFLRAMKTIATGDPGYLPLSPYPQYNHPLIKAQRGDVIFEGGAESGHTTINFSRQISDEGRIYAFEALPPQIPALKQCTKSYSNIFIEPFALWSCSGTFYIENYGAGSRVVSNPTKTTQTCHSISIDYYITQHSERCDMIKLDIEGAEEECLKGAIRTLRHYRPKLQISLYHQELHYIDIPLMLMKENLDYKIYCGHHGPWYWETVLYAISSQKNCHLMATKHQESHTTPVSIVIPTYNNEATLERCLDSVLLQQIPDMEIIVVDNASTDKTPEIISNYVQHYPQIIRSLHFSENKGAGYAINAGIEIATGKYLTFIESTEILAEDILETGLQIMDEEEADILGFDIVMVQEDPWKETLYGVEAGIWAGKNSLEKFLLKKLGHYGISGRLYRSTLIHRYNICSVQNNNFGYLNFSIQAFYFSQKTLFIKNIGIYKYCDRTLALFNEKSYIFDFSNIILFITTFVQMHGIHIKSDIYQHFIKTIYCEYRDKLYSEINKAEKNGKIEEVLNPKTIQNLASSQTLLSLILTDYAILHSYNKPNTPRVLLNYIDKSDISHPQYSDQNYISYGKADILPTKKPLLSVILPNYNKIPYIENCLKSILMQSMQDFELIIIDDTSTDGSYTILQDYADLYSKIRLYRMNFNSKQSICRNIGIDLSRGDYIIFVDSDDKVEEGFFEESVALIKDKKPDVIFFASNIEDVSGNTVYSIKTQENMHLNSSECVKKYFSGEISPEPWSKVYRLDFIKSHNIRFIEHVHHQDQHFTYSIVNRLCSAIMSPKISYTAIKTPNSTSRPNIYTYTYIHSGFLLQKHFSDCFDIADISDRNYILKHARWHMENIFLPAIYAYHQAINTVPIKIEDFNLLQKSLNFIKMVLIDFSKKYDELKLNKNIFITSPSNNYIKYKYKENTNPLISVIIPTYNQENCICRCLDSILHQSLRSIEIIIIDDASTDQTLAICQLYSQKDPRVHVFSNAINSGQGINRNKALEKAKGKYITYVDSDDYILPDFLLHGCSILERHPQVDFVHFSYSRRNLSGAVEKWECDEDALRNGLEVLDLYCNGKTKSWAAWSKIYRHYFLKNNKIYFPKYFFEDNLFLLQTYLYAKNILFINKQGYVNFIAPHTASTMNPIKSTHRHIKGLLNLAKDITDFFEKNSSLGINHLLISRLSAVFWLYKKNISYISSYHKLPISPFTDKDITHLKSAPDFLRIILEDYARLYAQHTNYKAKLPQDDLDPLCEKRSPAQEIFPYSFHPVEQKSIQLSVIVSAYNVSPYLNKCLDSILLQYTDNIEIIIVEDCSRKDNTFEICQEYAQKYSCIRLFRTPWNSGLGTVRNLAMNEAKGAYVTFVDSDDWLEPYFFQHAFMALKKYPQSDLVVCNVNQRYPHGSEPTTIPDGQISGTDMLYNYVYSIYNHYGSWGILYKKSYLEKNNIKFGIFYNEDEIFLLKAYYFSSKITLLSYVGYNYVRNSNTPTIMRPQVKGKEYFSSTIYNIKQTHSFLLSCPDIGENSEIYKKRMASLCQFVHHKENLLYYIHACKELGLPSPLTDEVLEALTCSDAFLRALLMDHAVLSQKPLPQQKAPVPSHFSPQVTAAPRPQPVKNAPRRESDRQHLCPHIPDIGMGSFFERALWKVAPKRAAVYALRRSHCFDINYYKAMYPDVAKAGVDPVLHYVYFGAKEGRNPAPWFNTSLYVADNPDVIAAGVNPFYHYIRYGHAENRRPAA